jgi:PhzF family phenazine biosynthesis protein
MVVLKSEEKVRSIVSDFAVLKTIPTRGVLVTAAAEQGPYDFVSRFFAPAAGIDEDPVTGSAHCALGPYWQDRLDKNPLVGYQASRRGGVVRVETAGPRILLGGQGITVLKGELSY